MKNFEITYTDKTGAVAYTRQIMSPSFDTALDLAKTFCVAFRAAGRLTFAKWTNNAGLDMNTFKLKAIKELN